MFKTYSTVQKYSTGTGAGRPEVSAALGAHQLCRRPTYLLTVLWEAVTLAHTTLRGVPTPPPVRIQSEDHPTSSVQCTSEVHVFVTNRNMDAMCAPRATQAARVGLKKSHGPLTIHAPGGQTRAAILT